MKRWAALGILAGFGFVLSGSCQGPDAFYRLGGGGIGGRGVGGSGFGGFVGLGGSLGLGGAFLGLGGRGAGGATGIGGRGTGGATGTGGTTGSAGMTGVDGGSGVGGRVFDAGSGCVATIIANGYSAGTAPPCSQCRENGVSLADKCMRMIDCLAPSCRTGNCYTDCLHSVSGSGPLDDCVTALVNAACGP